jgi:hypothetical protein
MGEMAIGNTPCTGTDRRLPLPFPSPVLPVYTLQLKLLRASQGHLADVSQMFSSLSFFCLFSFFASGSFRQNNEDSPAH